MGSFNRPGFNVNANILPSSFVSLNSFPILSALSINLLSLWTLISCHLHLFPSMLVLFYGPLKSTCYQCECQYLVIFICFLECWSYSMGSFNGPAMNVNFNILPSWFVCLNAGPLLWALSIDLLSMWTTIPCHLPLFASILVLFYRLFQSTCYQCELQYLAIFICLLECFSYSMGSFIWPAINVNSNILPSSYVCLNADPIWWALSMDLLSMWTSILIWPSWFICLNAGPILWPHSIELLSVWTSISCHLHFFAWMLDLFCGLFQLTCYQCELQCLAILICFLEGWSYSMGSFKGPAINVNFNILPSSLLCLNAGPILSALSNYLLSMWTSISSHLHLFAWMLILFYGLLQLTCYQFGLKSLAIFISSLEYWSVSVASFNWPPINVNSNILPSSFVCLNDGPILWALSMDLLST